MDINQQIEDLAYLILQEVGCDISEEDCRTVASLVVKRGYIRQQEGKWIEQIYKPSWMEDDVEIFYECSICGIKNWDTPPYCPSCGSTMKNQIK